MKKLKASSPESLASYVGPNNAFGQVLGLKRQIHRRVLGWVLLLQIHLVHGTKCNATLQALYASEE